MSARAEGWAPPVPLKLRTVAEIVRTLDGLDELAASWDVLGGNAGSPTLSHDWTRECAAAFAGAGALRVLVVGAPHARAVAPLVRRDDTVSRLELLGVEELAEPSDLLAADPAALAQLAEELVQTGEPIHLKRVPADSPAVAVLRRAYRGKGVVISRPHAAYPWVPLDETWLSPERRLNAGRRSDVRRARRIAESMGAVSIEVLSPSHAELEPLLEEAFCVEAANWKGRRGSAVLHDPAVGQFFRRYAHSASRRGILRLGFLRIGGRPAAMQLAVEANERIWLFKMGYDETFARCSPGTLLMLEMLRHAAARGLRSYELLGTVEPWTTMWTQFARPCVSLRAYPRTGHGMAALMVDVARAGGRRLGRLGGAGDGQRPENGQEPERNPENVLASAG
jgi:CelD/BcsL family acetyltransferase involved in cellulose biosynthesis